MYSWMMTNKFFGKYLRDYRAGLGVPVTTKLLAIGVLWLGVGISAGLVVRAAVVRVILLVIAVAVTVHIVLLRTK